MDAFSGIVDRGGGKADTKGGQPTNLGFHIFPSEVVSDTLSEVQGRERKKVCKFC